MAHDLYGRSSGQWDQLNYDWRNVSMKTGNPFLNEQLEDDECGRNQYSIITSPDWRTTVAIDNESGRAQVFDCSDGTAKYVSDLCVEFPCYTHRYEDIMRTENERKLREESVDKVELISASICKKPNRITYFFSNGKKISYSLDTLLDSYLQTSGTTPSIFKMIEPFDSSYEEYVPISEDEECIPISEEDLEILLNA